MSEQTSSICVGCKWAKWDQPQSSPAYGVCAWPLPKFKVAAGVSLSATRHIVCSVAGNTSGFVSCPVREPQEAQP